MEPHASTCSRRICFSSSCTSSPSCSKGRRGACELITQNKGWLTYTDTRPWREADWVIPVKVVKELNDHPFDGNIVNYKGWHERFVNHLLYQKQGYGKILHLTETCPAPITFQSINAHPWIQDLNADLRWISMHLWTFMVRHLSKAFQESIRGLVNGEMLNGLELWRVMFCQNRGGSIRVGIAETRSLHRFPACTDSKHLAQYLGEFVALMDSQGQGLPEANKVVMLTEMLPKDAIAEIRLARLQDGPYQAMVQHLRL